MSHVIASDTDSAYFVLTNLIKKIYPDSDSWPKKKRIEVILKLTNKIQEKANTNLNLIAKELFNIKGNHHFQLKQEVIAEKAYWSGKRRYAMFIVNKEGVDVKELDMKGLDIMKSNFPPYFRTFGEKIITEILFGKTKKDIDELVKEFKKSLFVIDWKFLLKPTGLKKLEEYIELKARPGELFSTLKTKCPINTKSAIFYNDFLRHYKINDKYPEFMVGDKMFIAYLKQNPYNINVIGYNGYNDPPQITKLINDYIDREELFESIIKNKLENLYNDIGWELVLNKYKTYFFEL